MEYQCSCTGSACVGRRWRDVDVPAGGDWVKTPPWPRTGMTTPRRCGPHPALRTLAGWIQASPYRLHHFVARSSSVDFLLIFLDCGIRSISESACEIVIPARRVQVPPGRVVGHTDTTHPVSLRPAALPGGAWPRLTDRKPDLTHALTGSMPAAVLPVAGSTWGRVPRRRWRLERPMPMPGRWIRWPDLVRCWPVPVPVWVWVWDLV